MIAIGEVLVAHVGDAFIQSQEPLRFDTPAMKLIGRMHGADQYLRMAMEEGEDNDDPNVVKKEPHQNFYVSLCERRDVQ